MNIRSLAVAMCSSFFMLSAFAQGQAPTLPDAVECSPRNGLPNFFAKCEKGGTVKVAYFGGSVTAQAGWRVQSLDLLRRLYPKTKFEEVYAPIGGTGSDFGVYRLEHDVTNYKPDLLFVEFGINDESTPPDKVKRTMEGIVRNTWETLPNCDICFVYTINPGSFKYLQKGQISPTVNAHENVAAHYGIPTIHMGLEIAALDKAGKLAWKEPQAKLEQVAGKELDKSSGVQANPDGRIPFSPDGVHPYLDTGHKLYTAAIERSLPKIKAASETPAAHSPLSEPLAKDYVKKTSFFEADAAKMSGAWTKVEEPAKTLSCGDLARFVPSVWCGKPDATLSFDFTGRSVMLFLLYGPGTGKIEVTLDGKTSSKVCFDPWSAGWRLVPFLLSGLEPGKTHSLSIKVLGDEIDKRKILSGKNPERGKLVDMNPKRFEDTDFYLGAISIEDGGIAGK